MEKTIYDLKLHESLVTIFGIIVIRVPGGWLYNETFVPWNNDLKELDINNSDLPF